MKFFLIPYIALGLIFPPTAGIEYNCSGSEMLPGYYGSPFIFKQVSLGSSLTYYYSVSGLVANVLLWSLILYLVNKGMEHLRIVFKNSIWFNKPYQIVIGVMLFYATSTIAFSIITLGNGFEKDLNYWYWDMEKLERDWNVNCKGEWFLF